MKGRTKCPQCKHEFVMEIKDDLETCEITCPKCDHKFSVRQSLPDQPKSDDECGWEEHGEPRKTILSSLKCHTNRPMIASFLLLTTCVLGVFNAAFITSGDNLIIPYLNISLDFLTDVVGNLGLSIALIIFSGFAFIGFIASFRRRYINAAIICAFLGIFSIGFFIGTVLCIIALILIIICREEFENATKGKVF